MSSKEEEPATKQTRQANRILVRAVDTSIWTADYDGFDGSGVAAEVLQNQKELKVKGTNTLSFWRFNTDDENWESDAVLAVIGGWKKQFDGGLTLISIREELLDPSIRLSDTPGDTCFESLKSKHVDAANLDAHRFALVATYISQAIEDGAICRTRREVVTILSDAIVKRRMHERAQLPQLLKGLLDEHSTQAP